MDGGARTLSVLDRAPPADDRAERALLGALLTNPEAIATIAAFLQPADFSGARNARVYEVMVGLYERRQPGDSALVLAESERLGQVDLVGGTAYVAALANHAPTSLHAEAYARLVERAAIMRRLIGAADQISTIGYENPPDVDEALD